MKNNVIRLGLLSLLFLLLGPVWVKAAPLDKARSLSSIQQVDTLSSGLSNYLFLRLNMQTDPPQMDTVSYLYNQYIEELDYLNDESVPMRYIAPDPYYYRLTAPLVLYNSPMKYYDMPEVESVEKANNADWKKDLLAIDDVAWTRVSRANKIIDGALFQMYMNDISQVVTTENRIQGHKLLIAKVEEDKRVSSKEVNPLFKADADLGEGLNMVETYIRKPNWWLTGGEGSLQMTQNYISENWHKGGESNNSLLGSIKLFANYNDREKIQFENILEGKFGFNTISSDTVRSYRINTDLIRLSSKLGVRATKNWYYTISGSFTTQFAPNYKKNTDEMVSAFLAPANFVVGLGMDYKLRKRKIDLSVILSPATYNLRYVRNDRVDETRFGLKEGDNILHDVGSKVESRMVWKIFPSIVWDSRFVYFTNYEKVESEWENTFNFILNRYLSTKLYVHTRFDDAAKRVGDKSYFQVNERLSFGINYKW